MILSTGNATADWLASMCLPAVVLSVDLNQRADRLRAALAELDRLDGAVELLRGIVRAHLSELEVKRDA